jgi:hypothetical protein
MGLLSRHRNEFSVFIADYRGCQESGAGEISMDGLNAPRSFISNGMSFSVAG